MKIIVSLFFIVISLFPDASPADNLTTIRKAARECNCIPLGDVKEKPRYLSRVHSWHITYEQNGSSATLFWCKNPQGERNFKIVVTSQDKNHPWAECPSTIETVGGFSPLNLSLMGESVSGEYNSTGYLFSCTNGNWVIKISD